jgi:DNA polymerase-3 subunit delta'
MVLGWPPDDDNAAKPEAKPSKEIRITQMRPAIDWAQRTTARGGAKVLLVHPADALNLYAANALLKTLEEPPGSLRLVLTSADPERLLPTVRSRCQMLRLALPDAAQARAWLVGRGVARPDELLRLAGGSPLEALAWSEQGVTPELIAELPRRIAAGDSAPLAGRATPRVIDLLLRLAHDLMAQAAGGEPRFFAAATLPAGARIAALVAWQRELLRIARHDGHPWQAPLLIEALTLQARGIWPPAGRRGDAARGSASLHSPS